MGFTTEELEGKLEELQGCTPMGRTMILANQTPQGSQGLNHQPRDTHDSSQKSGRGMPCWASVGGDVLGPLKAQKRSQWGEIKWGSWEWVGWRSIFLEAGGLGVFGEGGNREGV